MEKIKKFLWRLIELFWNVKYFFWKKPKYLFSLGLRHSVTLRNKEELKQATKLVKQSKLIPHVDKNKNWDSIYFLNLALTKAKCEDWVLDAGCTKQSPVLPWLNKLGYKKLLGINLCFKDFRGRKGIGYKWGNIESTDLPNETFQFIMCQSVIEHGVDIKKFFKEMARILKNGGSISISTDLGDNWDFKDIEEMAEQAKDYNLKLIEPIDKKYDYCLAPPIANKYTFTIFTLEKDAGISSNPVA